MSPNKAVETEANILTEKANKRKEHNINRRNLDREEYNECRSEGFIRNYKHLRHKNEPYFRKKKLQNVHPTTVKRPNKFAGSNLHNALDNSNDSSGSGPSTSHLANPN